MMPRSRTSLSILFIVPLVLVLVFGTATRAQEIDLDKLFEEPPVSTSEVYKQCLFVWDDSWQPHTIVKWKKLRHCYEISMAAPVNLGSIGEEYVRACIDRALNEDKAMHIVTAIAALVADAYGAGGSAIGAKLTHWVEAVSSSALDCLTDVNFAAAFIDEAFSERFVAEVRHVSHWVYY